jgi:phage repressor protein C with HTH and peptisase S24 domain
MDLHYRDGSYVVVEPWFGGPLPVGKHVVVERELPSGMIETTIKELVRTPGGELELWPRSRHPSHQTPVPYQDVDDVTVRVIGRVIWALTPVP